MRATVHNAELSAGIIAMVLYRVAQKIR